MKTIAVIPTQDEEPLHLQHVECVEEEASTIKNKEESGEDDEEEEQEVYGTCCFCGDDCNPLSQACGACIRTPFSPSTNRRKKVKLH